MDPHTTMHSLLRGAAKTLLLLVVIVLTARGSTLPPSTLPRLERTDIDVLSIECRVPYHTAWMEGWETPFAELQILYQGRYLNDKPEVVANLTSRNTKPATYGRFRDADLFTATSVQLPETGEGCDSCRKIRVLMAFSGPTYYGYYSCEAKSTGKNSRAIYTTLVDEQFVAMSLTQVNGTLAVESIRADKVNITWNDRLMQSSGSGEVSVERTVVDKEGQLLDNEATHILFRTVQDKPVPFDTQGTLLFTKYGPDSEGQSKVRLVVGKDTLSSPLWRYSCQVSGRDCHRDSKRYTATQEGCACSCHCGGNSRVMSLKKGLGIVSALLVIVVIVCCVLCRQLCQLKRRTEYHRAENKHGGKGANGNPASSINAGNRQANSSDNAGNRQLNSSDNAGNGQLNSSDNAGNRQPSNSDNAGNRQPSNSDNAGNRQLNSSDNAGNRQPSNSDNAGNGQPSNSDNAGNGQPSNSDNAGNGQPSNSDNAGNGQPSNSDNAGNGQPSNSDNAGNRQPKSSDNAGNGQPSNSDNAGNRQPSNSDNAGNRQPNSSDNAGYGQPSNSDNASSRQPSNSDNAGNGQPSNSDNAGNRQPSNSDNAGNRQPNSSDNAGNGQPSNSDNASNRQPSNSDNAGNGQPSNSENAGNRQPSNSDNAGNGQPSNSDNAGNGQPSNSDNAGNGQPSNSDNAGNRQPKSSGNTSKNSGETKPPTGIQLAAEETYADTDEQTYGHPIVSPQNLSSFGVTEATPDNNDNTVSNKTQKT